MIIALYKNTDHTFNRLVSWWTKGPYSHCELIFSTGMSGSSSFRDKGVRVKRIGYKPDNWDFIVLPDTYDAKAAEKWFEDHAGDGFDVLGIIGFVWRALKQALNRWFCAESNLAALGRIDAWRFCPNDFPSYFGLPVISGDDFDYQKYGVLRDNT